MILSWEKDSVIQTNSTIYTCFLVYNINTSIKTWFSLKIFFIKCQKKPIFKNAKNSHNISERLWKKLYFWTIVYSRLIQLFSQCKIIQKFDEINILITSVQTFLQKTTSLRVKIGVHSGPKKKSTTRKEGLTIKLIHYMLR